MKKYAVRFIREDKGPIEEYFYATRKEADNHLNLISDNSLGLYKFVAILNGETRTVERILIFENGKLRDDICDGDIVRLRSGFRRPEEAKFLFRVSNIHEELGHCLITLLNSNLPLSSSENVGLEMIDRVFSGEKING